MVAEYKKKNSRPELPAPPAPPVQPAQAPVDPREDAPRLILPTTGPAISAVLVDDPSGPPGAFRVVLVVRDREVAADLAGRGLALAAGRVRELAASWAAATQRPPPRAGGAWLSREEVEGVCLMLGGLPSALASAAFRTAFDQAERAAREVSARMVEALEGRVALAPTPIHEPPVPVRERGRPRLAPPETVKPDPSLPRTLDEREARERAQIVTVLQECNWNQTDAAKKLGMSRRTFIRRLDEFKIIEGRRRHKRRG